MNETKKTLGLAQLALLSLLFAFCSFAAESITFSLSTSDYVIGKSANACATLYLDSATANVKNVTVAIAVDGTLLKASGASGNGGKGTDASTWAFQPNWDAVTASATARSTVTATGVTCQISSPVGAYAVDMPASQIELGKVYFTVDDTKLSEDAAQIDYTWKVTATNYDNGSGSGKAFETVNPEKGVAQDVSVALVRAFNCGEAGNAVAFAWDDEESWESSTSDFNFYDENKTAIPANGWQIDSCNAKASQVVAYAAGSAEGTPLDVDDTAVYGTFEGTGNTITWTAPASRIGMNKYATYKLTVPFVGRQANGTATAKGEYVFTMSPVDQKPVLQLNGDIVLVEGKKVSVEAELADAEGDKDGDLSDASLGTVKVDGVEYAGTWNIAYAESGDKATCTFTSTNDLPYTTVEHPLQGRNVDVVVAAKGNCDGASRSGVTAIDTDQNPVWGDVALDFDNDTYYVADSATATLSGTFTDPDGDKFVVTYEWTQDGKTVTDTQDPLKNTSTVNFKEKGFVKGEVQLKATIDYYPYGEKYEGDDAAKTARVSAKALSILNSVPKNLTMSPLFVQKDASVTSVTFKVKADDDDAENLTYTVTSPTPDFITTDLSTVSATGAAGEEASFDAWTVNPDAQEGEYSIVIAVKDADNGTISETFSVLFKADPVPELVAESASPANGSEIAESLDSAYQTLSVKVKDGYVAGAPAPSGIANVELVSAKLNGNDVAIEEFAFTAATGSDESTVTGKFKLSPELLQGKDRPAKSELVITVKATDGNGAAATLEAWKLVITDTDRAPAAPATVSIEPAVTSTSEGFYTGDKVTISYADVEDEDGDEVQYSKQLYVNGEKVDSDTAVRKGEKLVGGVQAWSIPKYTAVEADKKASDETKSGEAIVKNTAPAIPTPAWVLIMEEDSAFACDIPVVMSKEPRDNKIAYYDLDLDKAGEGYETLRFSFADDTLKTNLVAEDSDAVYGEATINAESGIVTVTVAKSINTEGLENLPYVEVKVTDDQGESATAKVPVEITPVNDKPIVLNAESLYIVPRDMGKYQVSIVNVKMGDTEDENEQKIGELVDVALTDENSILDTVDISAAALAEAVENSDATQWIKDNYASAVSVCNGKAWYIADNSEEAPESRMVAIFVKTVSEGPAMGSSAAIAFAVEEDQAYYGEKLQSDLAAIDIMLGATPWFPIFDIDCADHDAHEVILTPTNDKDTKTYKLIVFGESVLPKDYIDAGYVDGLPAGATYEAAILSYDRATGEIGDKECTEPLTVEVSDYDDPATPSIELTYENEPVLATDSIEAGSKIDVVISVPLASSYRVEVVKNGQVVKTIEKDLTYAADGLVYPTAAFEYTFYEEGSYVLNVTGVHGDKESETVESVSFSVDGDEEPELEWPEDGVFTPSDTVKHVANEGDISTTFTWPVVASAVKYEFIYELDKVSGSRQSVMTSSNSYTVDLEMEGDSQKYNWYVIAYDKNGKELASNVNTFVIEVKGGETGTVTSIEAQPDGSAVLNFDFVPENVTVTCDLQLGHWNEAEGKAEWSVEKNVTVVLDSNNNIGRIDTETASEGDVLYVKFYYTDRNTGKKTEVAYSGYLLK